MTPTTRPALVRPSGDADAGLYQAAEPARSRQAAGVAPRPSWLQTGVATRALLSLVGVAALWIVVAWAISGQAA